jgi:starch-binding outer membrane protein, SusD/RagB family
MKHKIILISAAVLLLASSCEKQMNYNEYNIYDKDYIALNFTNVGGFMTDIYNTVPYDFGNYSSGAMLASASDESEYSKMGNAIEDFYNGAWSPSNAKSTYWSNLYTGIATCNTVLTEMSGLTFDELNLNDDYAQQMYRYNNYQYEARFMRAYFYFLLARQYGGVPIVGETMTPEEINVMKRSSADEVFQYIISECAAIQDKIINDYADLGDMALSNAETGRADRLAVLSLKAQAALYWASPLFNSSNDKERWHNAALYYKELLAACEKRGKSLAADYSSLWATDNYTAASITKEILFARRYYSSASGDHLVEGYNYPVGIEGGSGGNCPTQNLVDAYDMLNGKSINEAGSGYDENNPYAGRDPRFAMTVAYNGAQWPTYSGAPLLQTYTGGANAQPISGGTPTGYYLRKLCHGDISLADNGRLLNNFHTYVLYRVGAAYLDYAEAVYKYLGSADATSSEFPMSARELASKTRVRAGMPELPAGLSNDDFWTKYKNERMVELAFEGYRFWDVRRWKEADKYFTGITEMKITRNADGSFSYKRNTVNRQWNDKMYLFPIPQTEVMKNTNLEQNPGW